jgi:signal transduction histidine kinase
MLDSENQEQSTKHKEQSTKHKVQKHKVKISQAFDSPNSRNLMSQLKPPTPDSDESIDEGQVVYRRTPHGNEEVPSPVETIQARAREIAPAITPLIIGFTVLLALIFVLGYLSIRRMDEVSTQGRELELQHSARLSLLLNLRLALTKLDNEARLRQQAESRGELKPPLDLRLSTARDEINRLLPQIERPPLSEDPNWSQFRRDLQAYAEVTEDLRRYSLEGYTRFKTVDTELNNLFETSRNEQGAILGRIQAIENNATRSIRLWSVIVLFAGAFVAIGTIWEVQRRFREMRRSMVEASRERAFTNQLLEGMVSAVAAIDNDDRIRSANAAFFEIFPRASIGASVLEKFAAEDAMKMLEAASATQVSKATYRGRWVSLVKGEEKSFDVYSSPLAINATEVAESERTLRRSESLAAVGQATTQVAHEIRNPLGSIRLGVSMLRDSVKDKEGLNTIELVERGIKHLNNLVVDVTQFSRQKELDRAQVDLHELLERSLDLVSERIREKSTVIEKKFIDQKLIGSWDADQLRQVFVNVIANAIDASQEKDPIRISTESVRIDGGSDGQPAKSYARVTVADPGKGMDQTTREHIFEPFFSTKKRGTGLGLAIVKQIVEQHGGQIEVKSEPGEGSRFIIDLPL